MKKAESRESFVGVPYGVLVERDSYSIEEVEGGKVRGLFHIHWVVEI